MDYESSALVAKTADVTKEAKPDPSKTDNTVNSNQSLASKVNVGMRIPSVKVLNQSDARPWHLHERLPSNGTWRLLLFVGDIKAESQKQKMLKLCEPLAGSKSFLNRFTPAGGRYDSVFEVLTVHAAPRTEVTIFDFPEVLRPYDKLEGWDYNKIFVDNESYHEGHGKIYETFGIDPQKGCAVVLRPDQYVSYVGELSDYESLDKFFSAFMIPQA